MRQLTRALSEERTRQGETAAQIRAERRRPKFPDMPPFYTVTAVHDGAGLTVEPMNDDPPGRSYFVGVPEAAEIYVEGTIVTIHDNEEDVDEIERLFAGGARHLVS